MQADGWEVNGEATVHLDSSFDGLDELGDVCVARVESTVCVDDPDDWSGKGVFAIACGFDESFPEEEGEVCIAIRS